MAGDFILRETILGQPRVVCKDALSHTSAFDKTANRRPVAKAVLGRDSQRYLVSRKKAQLRLPNSSAGITNQLDSWALSCWIEQGGRHCRQRIRAGRFSCRGLLFAPCPLRGGVPYPCVLCQGGRQCRRQQIGKNSSEPVRPIVILSEAAAWRSQAAAQSKDLLPACAATGPSGNFLFRERCRKDLYGELPCGPVATASGSGVLRLRGSVLRTLPLRSG